MATAATKTNANGASTADLNEQIETLRADLGQMTQIIANLGEAKGEEVVAAARSAASTAQGKIADQAEAARLQAAELQGQANEFIAKQPAMALGIAAGLGFLVGFLGSRK